MRALLRSPVTATVVVVVGLLMLLSQALVVLLGHSLNTGEQIVMWVGLGVVALGAGLLVLAVASGPSHEGSVAVAAPEEGTAVSDG